MKEKWVMRSVLVALYGSELTKTVELTFGSRSLRGLDADASLSSGIKSAEKLVSAIVLLSMLTVST